MDGIDLQHCDLLRRRLEFWRGKRADGRNRRGAVGSCARWADAPSDFAGPNDRGLAQNPGCSGRLECNLPGQRGWTAAVLLSMVQEWGPHEFGDRRRADTLPSEF